MSNELKKHKRSDTVKWVIVFVCIALLTVAVIAALTRGFTDPNPYGWLDKQYSFELYEDTAEESPKASVYAAEFDGEIKADKEYTFDVKFVYTDKDTDAETITLPLDKDGTYEISEGKLPVTLEVSEGRIRFINSRCPDHICEGYGWLSKEHDQAVCMPAGVVVSVEKGA